MHAHVHRPWQVFCTHDQLNCFITMHVHRPWCPCAQSIELLYGICSQGWRLQCAIIVRRLSKGARSCFPLCMVDFYDWVGNRGCCSPEVAFLSTLVKGFLLDEQMDVSDEHENWLHMLNGGQRLDAGRRNKGACACRSCFPLGPCCPAHDHATKRC